MLVEDEDVDGTDDTGQIHGARRRTNLKDRGEKYRKEVEREVDRIKVKVGKPYKKEAQVISWRQRSPICLDPGAQPRLFGRGIKSVGFPSDFRINLTFPAFLFGVLSLAFTCLLYGIAPEWIPFAYTAQSAVYLPIRIWTYKMKAWHYFLFGELGHIPSNRC